MTDTGTLRVDGHDTSGELTMVTANTAPLSLVSSTTTPGTMIVDLTHWVSGIVVIHNNRRIEITASEVMDILSELVERL